MEEARSLRTRLITVLGVIGLIAIGGVLAILPYRLYERDIRHARVEAHRLSSVIHVALSDALRRREDVTDLINRVQSIADFELRLRKLDPGEHHPAEMSRRATGSPFGTDLTYVAPPILDGRGSTWLAEMHFDLSPMKRDSIRLIVDLVIAVVLGSVAFSLAVFFLVQHGLLRPLRELAETISKLEPGAELPALPEFASLELRELARSLSRRHGPGPD